MLEVNILNSKVITFTANKRPIVKKTSKYINLLAISVIRSILNAPIKNIVLRLVYYNYYKNNLTGNLNNIGRLIYK